MTQAAFFDVTAPGNTVKGVPDDGDWPGGETPPLAIDDNLNAKYLHFKGAIQTTGFCVTPSLSGMVVTGLTFATANDSPERDPIAFELSGSNVSIDGPYTLIASGDIVDFKQATAWPRYTMNKTPISFANAVAYAHYQVLFTAVRDAAAANSMQIGEVELLAEVTLPAGIAHQDVGNPALAGSVSYDPVADAWTIRGAGSDIWGSSDQFQFVFRPLAGNGSGIVRIVSMNVTNEWAKVGVMIRETLAANSKHVMVSMTGTHGAQTVWRQDTGGESQSVELPGVMLPLYVKIERVGDTISTSTTWDPAFWIPQATVTIPMNANVYIGMFVCSHDASRLCTTVFDKVTLTAPAYKLAWALSPLAGTVLDPAGTTLSWMAGDTAASHDVYLGASSPPAFVGNQTATTYATGALQGGKVYYWRIDEVEADGVTKHAGAEQSFKTIRAGTGTILREVWEGIGGTVVSDLTNNANYPANPSWSDEITSFNVDDFADNFGSRIHGWLLPETSGDYTFWVASDDASGLWLSTSDSPADAVRIAYVDGWTGNRAWDSVATQKSAPVSLTGGKMYYISALYKEGGGGDNCSAAWEGPDSPTRGVIAGYYLMPFENLWAYGPSPADGATEVGMSPTLSWLPAVDAVSYNVYLNGALLGNTTETSLPAGDLLLDKTYDWRVDTVAASQTRTGVTWSFTVANNRLIDDFSSYDPEPEKTAPQFITGVTKAVPPSTTGLLAHYEFNDGAKDSSGNGRDGTLVGDTNAVVAGGVLKLDGKAGCVDIGSDPVFNPAGSFSIAARVKMTAWGGSWGNIIVGKRGESNLGWQLRRNSGNSNLSFTLRGTSGDDDPRGVITPPLNEWINIAAVYDADARLRTVYINGKVDAQLRDSGKIAACDHKVYIGARAKGDNTGPEGFFNGEIDDLAIYSRALSAGEVRYLAGLGDQDVYGPMRLYAKLDGNLNDSSGNGKNGTMVGGDPVFEAGKIGQAIHLDGVDDYVQFGDVGVGGPAPRTVSAWVKGDVLAGSMADWTNIFGFSGQSVSYYHFDLEVVNVGGVRAYGIHCYGWEAIIMPIDLEWHNLAASYDGTTLKYYGDGKFVGSNSSLNLRTYANVHMGKRFDNTNYFRGMVDDGRIYDYALTDNQIAAVANRPAATNPISDTWSDWGVVDLVLDAGAMRVDSYSLPGMRYYIGEVGRAAPFADLTAGGAKALSVWFSGDPGNVARIMYLAVTDGDGGSAYVGYDGALTSTEWQEWNIDMRDLAGVNLANTTEIGIGLAGLDGGIKADVMRFDDIRVYASRCMPEVVKPAADINNDCKVDLGDVQIMINAWGPITPTYTVKGDGADVWGNADAFHYMYKELSGNGEIIARVAEIGSGTSTWAKAGVMIRETLNADSKHLIMALTGGDGGGIAFQGRPQTAGASISFHGDITASPPYWVKLTRVGNTITGYCSANGVDWVLFTDTSPDGAMTNPIDVAMADPIKVGLAMVSHTDGEVRTAKFDNVSINGIPAPELTGVDIGTTGGSSASAVTPSPADLYPDNVVNWKDFFVLLDGWLEVQMWPY
jgi:regulation of enolase protein 1 (concanavalin A-like superfamily)